MRKKYIIPILLIFSLIFIAACRPQTDEPQVPDDDTEAQWQPVITNEIPPHPMPSDHSFEAEAFRNGYSVLPVNFTGNNICTTTTFSLALYQETQELPEIRIDGQPNPYVEQVDETNFIIQPAIALSYNSLYILRFTEQDGTETTWAFQTVPRFAITATLPTNQSTNVPVTTGIEITPSIFGHSPIADHFSISPPVSGRFIEEGNTAIFMPIDPLEYGQFYTVTISAGLELYGTNQVIEEDFVFSFETAPSSDPNDLWSVSPVSFSFNRRYIEFPSFEPVQFGFRLRYEQSGMRRPAIIFNVYKFNDNEHAIREMAQRRDIPHWASFARQQNLIDITDSGFSNVMSSIVTEQQGEDRWSESKTLPDLLAPGFYVINATVGDFSEQTILQITDIAVQVVGDGNTSLVWVNDMTTGSPAVGATVTLEDDGGRYRTDRSGIAIIGEDLAGAPLRIRTADNMESIVFTGNFGGASQSHWGSSGSRVRDDNYWSIVQLDRTLFQRADTLNFWGFAEHRDEDYEINYVTAIITRSGHWMEIVDDSLHSHTVTVHQGSFSGEIVLPYLDPGSYVLSIQSNENHLGSVFFSVDDFVTPPYRLTITPSRRAVFAGENVDFTLRTEFFEGTPVAQLDVSYSFSGHGINESREGSAVTDIEGNFTVSTGSLTPTQEAQGRTRMSFSADATLPEVGRTWVGSSVSVFINDIDVSATASRTGQNANISIDVNSITLDRLNNETAIHNSDFIDAPVRGQAISVAIYRIFWVRERIGEEYDRITRRVVPTYRFNRREERIDSFELTTGINGRAERDFTVPNRERESYIARISTIDGNRRNIEHDVWIGRDFSNAFWNMESNAVFLETNRENNFFDLDEAVEVTVMQGETPVERGETLFVVASRGIIKHYVGDNRFNFTFDKQLMPNATVYAFYFNGHTYHSDWGMSQSLSFNFENREINVDVTPNRETFMPGEMATILIRTTDQDGNPKSANVNVSIVDEALFALRDYSVNTLSALYRRVASGLNLQFATHPTFVSEGFDDDEYGLVAEADSIPLLMADSAPDASIRELFEDTAHFRVVQTNDTGVARFMFRLPDNITSWRMTTSAVTTDFYAGNDVQNISVRMPMFLHYSLNSVFLTGDTPSVGVNVYGSELSGNELVTFEVWDNQNPDNVLRATDMAFERVNIPLWEMVEGTHSIVISATTDTGLSDAVRHTFDVFSSHRSIETAFFYDVTPYVEFDVGESGLTNITFTDRGRGQFLRELISMRHVRGGRIEGLLLRREATQMIYDYFPETYLSLFSFEDDFAPIEFQQGDGGISILPYAASDLELTVHILSFIKNDINESALRHYLRDIFESSGTQSRIQALYGLAQLGEPILSELRDYAMLSNLSVSDAAYLALALNVVGERDRAISLYNAHILPHMERIERYYRVGSADTLEQIMRETAIVALLALRLDMPESAGLNNYTLRHDSDDLLTALYRLYFVESQISNLSDGPVNITYTLFGAEHTRDLTNGRSFTLRIAAANMHEFNLINITGDVGAVLVRRVTLDDTENISDEITVTRQFFRAGTNRPTTTFEQGDLIRVEISIDYSAVALTGSYMVTDFIPAGLTFTQNSARIGDPREEGGGRFVWATVEASRITFHDHNPHFDGVRTYFYYARVVNPGTFRAEGTVVQNVGALSHMSVGEDANITIVAG